MNKAIRTALSLGTGLVLLSAFAIAEPQAAAKDSGKENKKQSRVGKVAFWRHHKKDDSTKAKSQTPSRQEPAKTSQVKPASAKPPVTKNVQKQGQQPPRQVASKGKAPAPARHAGNRKPQVKPASAKQPVGKKKEQKEEQQPAEHK